MTLLLSLKGLWDRRHEVVAGLLVVSLMVIYCLVIAVRAKNAALAARPAIEESSSLHTVKGQTVTKERERRESRPASPGCLPVEVVVVEREIVEGPVETIAASSRKETPVAAPPALWRAASLEYAPVGKRIAARLDADLGRFRFSARHELPGAGRLEFQPWVGVGFRF